MASDDSLHLREKRRRSALWTLAHLAPGDPRALCILRVLDEIDHQEQAWLGSSRIATVHEVTNQVGSEHHSIGISIVQENSIPEPWRERFLCASYGSTRVVEGAYLQDWQKFLSKWQQEMTHLERHRAERDQKG
jgi:hypothetical protein